MFSWNNIHVSIKHKTILENNSSSITSGEIMSIMGPSGSGKTTLLNTLSQQLPSHYTSSGSISYSPSIMSKPIPKSSIKKYISYVPQEDHLFPTHTPREALMFSASLRLSSTIPYKEKHLIVNDLIEQLSLQSCADTLIGSNIIKGLSGGEKKRTSIGIEIIAEPDIIFLDEPTSGLDSFSAYNIISLLKNIATSKNKIIITTIHQPSYDIFEMFDKLMIITKGNTIYNSSTSNLISYLTSIRYICPKNNNPADYIISLSQKTSDIPFLIHSWNDYSHTLETLNNQSSPYLSTDTITKTKNTNTIHTPLLTDDSLIIKTNGYKRPSCCYQLYLLSSREFQKIFRDYITLFAQFASIIFLNLIIASVFKDCATWTSDDTPDLMGVTQYIQNHFGALTQVAIGSMFALSQPIILLFPLERPIFLREYSVRMYSIIPYFISKMITEIPMAFIQTSFILLINYFLIGFQANFFYLSLSITLLGLTASSISILVGSIASNAQVAIQLSPLITVPQILFAGFFVSIQKIPSFIRWIQYICALKYGINLSMIYEFNSIPQNFPNTKKELYYETIIGCPFPVSSTNFTCPDNVTINENALFPRNNVYVDNEWIYFIILFSVFFGFRIMACIFLMCKSN
jgi:ABC-type multidrug transport system ATPase subunit/ABC-type multidrug transport system permease subunit